MEENKFPSNSHRDRDPRKKVEPQKKVERIVEGRVVRRKKPLSRRLKDRFVGVDGRSVGEVLLDVLVPAAKDMWLDAIIQSAERMIFPDARPSSRRSRRGGHPGQTHFNYSSRWSGGRRDPRDDQPQMSSRARANFDFDEMILPTRGEAEAILEQLCEIVSKYEVATVADLYTMVGIQDYPTDDKYGWVDLRSSGVSRMRSGGYLLDLPRPEPVD